MASAIKDAFRANGWYQPLPRLEPLEGQIIAMYIAFFGRAPDPAGLEYWVGQARKPGFDLNQVMFDFSSRDEFKARYGHLTPEQQIDQVYMNLYNRLADAPGKAYWLDIYSRVGDLAEVVRWIIPSAFMQPETSKDIMTMMNRIYVARDLTKTLNQGFELEQGTLWKILGWSRDTLLPNVTENRTEALRLMTTMQWQVDKFLAGVEPVYKQDDVLIVDFGEFKSEFPLYNWYLGNKRVLNIEALIDQTTTYGIQIKSTNNLIQSGYSEIFSSYNQDVLFWAVSKIEKGRYVPRPEPTSLHIKVKGDGEVIIVPDKFQHFHQNERSLIEVESDASVILLNNYYPMTIRLGNGSDVVSVPGLKISARPELFFGQFVAPFNWATNDPADLAASRASLILNFNTDTDILLNGLFESYWYAVGNNTLIVGKIHYEGMPEASYGLTWIQGVTPQEVAIVGLEPLFVGAL